MTSRHSIRIALLQLDPTVGDLAGNAERILSSLRRAEAQGAQIAVTPELCLTGYPPEDLLLRPAFIRSASRTLADLAAKTRSTVLICGAPILSTPSGASSPRTLRNSAAILGGGKMIGRYDKMALPNYGVFDEKRYFDPGAEALILRARPEAASSSAASYPASVAVSVCEDLWPEARGIYLNTLTGHRPDVIVNLSASPYTRVKMTSRLNSMKRVARETGAHVVYVNLVGGQDELIFDGQSFVVDPDGRVTARAKVFAEDLVLVDIPLRSVPASAPRPRKGRARSLSLRVAARVDSGRPIRTVIAAGGTRAASPGSDEEVLAAVEYALREYVQKNGFTSVGVAMSGGIDSALVAAIAVRALGPQKVVGVTMPSQITSSQTLKDAERQARTAGIRFFKIPIGPLVSAFLRALKPAVKGGSGGSMEENIQARVRGTLMMALSNRMGFLLLATGNKSELATGYCTLYGDMAGGFAPLKDLSKEWVYRLARCVNRLEGRTVIPVSVIRRAPTAELRPGQKDQDTLPPYEVLDDLLEALVEQDRSAADAAAKQGGARSRSVALDVAKRVVFNEYKRRQAPVGPKITSKAFGRDRRMPITQRGGEAF